MNTEINNAIHFTSAASTFDISLNHDHLRQFELYVDLLIRWNENINLVSRKMLEDENKRNVFIYEKCFLDSIAFLPEIKDILKDTESKVSILDIGSGAGFPAIPLAMLNPDWNFTLCESVGKKCTFLKELIQTLNLKNVRIEYRRVEELKSKYNLITARAVTRLQKLIEYALPRLDKNGSMAFYKAREIDEELIEAEESISNNDLYLDIKEKDINGVLRKLVCLKKA